MKRLNDFLAQRQHMPFKWGSNDCCLFIADWLLIATGNDYGLKFRGKYRTKKGAFRCLFKHGYKDIKTLFKACLNVEISPLKAKRGDVVLVAHNDELIGGIVGINCVAYVSDNGVVQLPMSAIVIAFSVSLFSEHDL